MMYPFGNPIDSSHAETSGRWSSRSGFSSHNPIVYSVTASVFGLFADLALPLRSGLSVWNYESEMELKYQMQNCAVFGLRCRNPDLRFD
jgi:hypothetical protein